VLRKQPSRLTLLMHASCSPDRPFHRSIGEIGDRKYFLTLALRELSFIRIRSGAKVIPGGQAERVKVDMPERMTQPPLPHPLRSVGLSSLSLLSVCALISKALVFQITTLLFKATLILLATPVPPPPKDLPRCNCSS
jgi:hypothetical protein